MALCGFHVVSHSATRLFSCSDKPKFVFMAFKLREGIFGLDDYQQVLVWKNNWGGSGRVKFYSEISASGSVSYYFRAYYKNGTTHSGIITHDFSEEQIRAGEVFLTWAFQNFQSILDFLSKAKGRFKLERFICDMVYLGKTF